MSTPAPRPRWFLPPLARAPLATLLLLVACDPGSRSPTGPEAPEAPDLAAQAARNAPDGYIVVFKPEVKDPRGAARRLAEREQAELRHTYARGLPGFSARMPAAAARRLAADPQVAYVEPNRIVRAFAAPTVQTPVGWNLDRIDRHPAKLDGRYGYTSTGAGVTVYVLDSGWGGEESEMSGRIVTIANFSGDATEDDLAGHGTHTTGTLASASYGVAKGAAVRMVKVLDQSASTTMESLLLALSLVIEDHEFVGGPAVANLSLGTERSQALNDAVTAVVAAGITVVVAAGNDGIDACNASPASAPAVLTVAASDRNDRAAAFSNYGPCVDLFAPGVDILSTWTYVYGPSAALASGTSSAAPHVTGAVARYLSLNPTASPAAVTAAILGKTSDNAITLSKLAKKTPNRLLYIDPSR